MTAIIVMTAMLPSSAQGGVGALKDLTTVLTDIKNAAADPTQITSIITGQLQRVAFFQTNFGEWLTSVLQGAGQASPLAALKDNSAVQAIRIGSTSRWGRVSRPWVVQAVATTRTATSVTPPR